MKRAPRISGIGGKETILALGVIVIFAAILITFALRSRNKSLLLDESGRMRRIYVGMSIYSQGWDSQPPLSLPATLPMVGDAENFTSPLDPYRDDKLSNFPVDPGIPSFESSPFRISFSYIENFRRAGKLKIDRWKDMGLTDNHGVLADEWMGQVEPAGSFRARVAGQILRILQDGSVYLLPDRGGPKDLGDPQDLFLKKR